MADETPTPTPKHWTPAPVGKVIHDTQVDVEVERPTPLPEALTEAEAEKAQPLPILTGLWVKLNGDGRIAKILGFGSPPPFDYAGVIARPSLVQRNDAGVVDFIPKSMSVVPLVNGTFIVLDKDIDLIAAINEAEAQAAIAAKARAEADSY